MLHTFLFIFAIFFIYSVIGWCIEVFLYLYDTGKYINRGFLVGPYLPIYGVCALLITTILHGQTDIFALFLEAALIASTAEYFTSYLMERLFKARWWDYSKRSFNINGRIWLGNTIAFGVLGTIMVHWTNPLIFDLLHHMNNTLFIIIFTFFFIILLIDIIVSLKIIKNLKLTAAGIKKDYTDEITKKVKTILYDKSYPFRRLFDAFPNLKAYYNKPRKKFFDIFKKSR